MEHIRIYQGDQIGGCVTVVSAMHNGRIRRIMIDYGSSLPGSDNKKDFDYPWDEEPVDAVFFTHYHGDHVGRLMEIPPDVPLYMGRVARQAMINIQEALGKSPHVEDREIHIREAQVLKDDKRVRTFEWNDTFYEHIKDIPGFVIEPYSVDHSAYDAYMFLIEADDPDMQSGKYITLHTGDFRGHGRRGHKMIKLINSYVRRFGERSIDALVIEGTMMSRSTEKVMSEPQMQQEAARYLKKNRYAFLICSSTNVDSLASFYQAAQAAAFPRERYMFVYSGYFKKQLNLFTKTAGSFTDVYKFKRVYTLDRDRKKKYHHPLWDRPRTQQEMMEEFGFVALIKPEEYHEQYIDAFVEAYRNKRIDSMPVLIFSMWKGYLDPDYKAFNRQWYDFIERQRAKGIEVNCDLHTSGHATPDMIARVINAVDPQDKLYPMHTEKREEFENLPIKEEIKERLALQTEGGRHEGTDTERKSKEQRKHDDRRERDGEGFRGGGRADKDNTRR